jgi:RNA polymerase sigma-70 factor (ECF subfamily)
MMAMEMTLSIRESLPCDGSPPAGSAETGVAALVAAARAGDHAAFEALHRRYAPMVHGVVLARVPAHAADDVVQDAFVHALRKLRQLRDAEAFGPWLAAIARRMAVRFHRRRRPARGLPEETLALVGGASADLRAEADRVLAHVRCLPESTAEILVLRLVEGLTGPQIALHLGMTHGSVRVALHRGMGMLRERLDAEDRRTEDRP